MDMSNVCAYLQNSLCRLYLIKLRKKEGIIVYYCIVSLCRSWFCKRAN